MAPTLRKRSLDSSPASVNSCSPFSAASASTRATSIACSSPLASSASCPRTPSSRRTSNAGKKVRISDSRSTRAGDNYENHDDGPVPTMLQSTGLTPAASRITLLPGTTHSNKHARTPIRRRKKEDARRARCCSDQAAPSTTPCFDSPRFDSDGVRQEYMFLPFNDILDSRTMRRIRRYGYSEEMHRINQDKRERQEMMKEKEDELRALREEVERLRRARQHKDSRLTPPTEDGSGASDAWKEINGLEALLRARETQNGELDISAGGLNSPPGDYDDNDDDDHTLIDEDEEPCSPTRRRSDADSQTASKDVDMDDAAPLALREELHQLREEKKSLFQQWRKRCEELHQLREEKKSLFQQWRKRCVPYTGEDAAAEPAADTIGDIVNSFQDVVASRVKVMSSLDKTYQDLSQNGFEGDDCPQIIANISQCFSDARGQLEKSLPATQEGYDLSNWKNILNSLVRRIDDLVSNLESARESAARNDLSLNQDLDNASTRLQRSEHLRKELETAYASMKSNMETVLDRLHTFEKQVTTLRSEKNRLALMNGSYKQQIKVLQDMNNTMEEQSLTALEKIERMERAGEKIARVADIAQGRVKLLESQITSETQRRQSVELLLEQRDEEISSLEESISDLRQDRDLVVADLQRNMNEEAEDHERELGILNIRVASLATRLDEAQTKTEELRRERDRALRKLETVRGADAGVDVEALHAMTQAVARQVGLWREQVAKLDDGEDSQEKRSDESDYEPVTPAISESALRVE
ncbi:hypothetical protein KEM56_000162 [Ascosphaera pollenicola]|nr:hypothetical protein KEM56_000162 [Ascosphaera pollenicola]